MSRRVWLAGAAAGAAGALAFGVAHAILILPIWQQVLVRIPVAAVAGIALAWAFDATSRSNGWVSIGAGARFGLVLFLTLAPATAFENALRMRGARLPDLVEVPAALLLSATAGAFAGWLLGRTRGAALAFAVASGALTTLMGGPIPVVNTIRAASLYIAFLPICIVAGGSLVAARLLTHPLETE